jgi:hypothetical protein
VASSPAAQHNVALQSDGLEIRREQRPPDQERMREERERMEERDREWTGENHERGKKKLALEIACDTVQRKRT